MEKILYSLRVLVKRVVTTPNLRDHYTEIRFLVWNPLTWLWLICHIIIVPIICMFTDSTVQDAYKSILSRDAYTFSTKTTIKR